MQSPPRATLEADAAETPQTDDLRATGHPDMVPRVPKQRASKNSGSRIARRRAAAKQGESRHYQARRREILDAAAKVFRTQGVAGTSIDDIAKVAGVDRASLYYYVGGKNELFGEVVAEAVTNNVKLAESIAKSDTPPEEKLRTLIGDLMASYAQFYPEIYVFLREDPETMSTQAGLDVPDLQRRFDRALTSIVREGMDAGVFRTDIPPRLVAYGIIGMLNWTYRWFHPDGPVDASDVARAFALLAVDGVRKR
jgi:AcrR family transcriptional regulator